MAYLLKVPRKKLNLIVSRVALDKKTDAKAKSLFKETVGNRVGISWQRFLGMVIEVGIESILNDTEGKEVKR